MFKLGSPEFAALWGFHYFEIVDGSTILFVRLGL